MLFRSNCYGVVPIAPISCRSARVDMLELWHHRFGQANFKQVAKVSKLEAEYIATGSCCTQFLWMKKLLHDYGIPQDTMCVFCDNTSAINLSKNPVQHSKSKHIEIHYHFIRALVEERVMCLEFIHTDNQKADIFTKPLDGPQFESLRKTIGVGTIS